MWSIPDIAEALQAGLTTCEAALELEQAVYGLDALDELSMHVLLQDGLRDAGFGVHPEQRYPRDRSQRKQSEGERCDIVLTQSQRALMEPDIEATLFEPPDAVPLQDAFWLEVKVVNQYIEQGANPRYAAELARPIQRDIIKLSKDPGIAHAATLIILHTADDHVASHDLNIWEDRCLRKRIPIGMPIIRRVPLIDRFGNRVCTLALYPVRQQG